MSKNLNVIEHDFADKAAMLDCLDRIRVGVESGDITGFTATVLCQNGYPMLYRALFNVQKVTMIGALENHKFALMAELQAEKLASELGL